MDIGQRWVYHPTKFDAVHCAEILKIGKKVKIRIHKSWLKGTFKVKREQLHVPWDQRAEYLASVKPYMDLSDQPGPEEDEWNAAEIVFVATGMNHHIDFHGYGCGETYDAPTVARACRISLSTLTKAPGTVVCGDHVAFPWQTTLMLARRLATTRCDAVLDYVRDDAQFWDERAQHNSTSMHGGLDVHEYDRLKATYDGYFNPGYEVVRRWCGVRRASQRQELEQLRSKYDRLLQLASAAAQNMSKTQANARLAAEIESLVAPDRKPGRV